MSKLANKLTFVPMPASLYPKVAVALKAAGYTSLKAGASKFIPAFATGLPGNGLNDGEAFKYFKHDEEYLPFKAVFLGGTIPAKTTKTAKTTKAVATGKPPLPKPWAEMSGKERAAYARSCKTAKAGNAPAKASGAQAPAKAAQQASGKLTQEAVEGIAAAAAKAATEAAIAALLAS